MASVSIPADYFAKSAKREYSDWRYALLREFVQNAIDGGANKINVEILHDGSKTITMRVNNNGSPMDRDTLENKLLALGGSTKNSESSVGGFGAAKLLLYFCHTSYRIHTGNLIVTGSGGQYEITESEQFVDGVENTITLDASTAYLHENLVEATKHIIAFSQLDCEIEFSHNCESDNKIVTKTFKPALHKGSARREFKWGKVYTNNTFTNRLIVRMNGICMFSNYVGFNKCVIIELTGKSTDLLTSSRDRLLDKYNQELMAFIGEITTDKDSALKKVAKTYMHYAGRKHMVAKTVEAKELETTSNVASEEQAAPESGICVAARATAQTPDRGTMVGESEARESVKNQLNSEFIIKNETDLTLPDYLMPHSEKFSKYAKTLAKYWANVMVELHKLFNIEGNFGTGFVISEESEAQHEVTSEYGRIYYVNPCKVVKQKGSSSRSLKIRFRLTEKDRLISLAVHELVHGIGCSYHDEQYANQLTDMFAVVLQNRTRLMKCFR